MLAEVVIICLAYLAIRNKEMQKRKCKGIKPSQRALFAYMISDRRMIQLQMHDKCMHWRFIRLMQIWET